MKKRDSSVRRMAILPAFALMLGMLTVCMSGCEAVEDSPKQLPEDSMIQIGAEPTVLLSNDRMQLELLPETMGVRVTDRRRGVV